MQQDDTFELISEEDVLYINNSELGRSIGISLNGFANTKIQAIEFQNALIKKLGTQNAQINSLLNEGIDCQIMQVGDSDWQSGKIKATLVLEFCSKEVSERSTCSKRTKKKIHHKFNNFLNSQLNFTDIENSKKIFLDSLEKEPTELGKWVKANRDQACMFLQQTHPR